MSDGPLPPVVAAILAGVVVAALARGLYVAVRNRQAPPESSRRFVSWWLVPLAAVVTIAVLVGSRNESPGDSVEIVYCDDWRHASSGSRRAWVEDYRSGGDSGVYARFERPSAESLLRRITSACRQPLNESLTIDEVIS